MSAMRRELAHAVRALARDLVFTLVCVVSLGTGMGAFVAPATPTCGIDSCWTVANALIRTIVGGR